MKKIKLSSLIDIDEVSASEYITFLGKGVIDELLLFKKTHNVSIKYDINDGGIMNSFYVTPSVPIELVDELSDKIDDLAYHDDEVVYCAFAFNLSDFEVE